DGLPYLGAGNYASSMAKDRWWFAPYEVERFCAAIEAGESLPVSDAYLLPPDERMAKQLLLSLNFGILDPARFRAQFGEELLARLGPPIIPALEAGGLAERRGRG